MPDHNHNGNRRGFPQTHRLLGGSMLCPVSQTGRVVSYHAAVAMANVKEP